MELLVTKCHLHVVYSTYMASVSVVMVILISKAQNTDTVFRKQQCLGGVSDSVLWSKVITEVGEEAVVRAQAHQHSSLLCEQCGTENKSLQQNQLLVDHVLSRYKQLFPQPQHHTLIECLQKFILYLALWSALTSRVAEDSVATAALTFTTCSPACSSAVVPVSTICQWQKHTKMVCISSRTAEEALPLALQVGMFGHFAANSSS